MGHRPFSKPLFLRLHRTGNFQARNAWEAHEYLDLHWPAARTAHYRQAKALCQSAIDGLVDAEAARRAVVDAAQRAGLLASRWEADDAFGYSSLGAHSAERPEAAALTIEDDEITDSDIIGYNSARDILDDPALPPSRKKALLAFWASDINAVAGAPGLRCVRGVTVTVDSLFEAMAKLDTEIDRAAMVRGSAGAGESW